VFLPFFFPADSFTPGAYFAQDTRCPAVGKRAMSSPVSARIACAAARLIPGTSSSLRAAAAKGAICSSIRPSRAAMSLVIASTRASIRLSKNAW
jgi:hypothetical protein